MSGLKLVSLDVVGGGQTRRDAFKPAWRTHIPAVKRDIFLGRRRCNGHFPVSAKQTCGPRSEQAERDQTADTEDETQSDASRRDARTRADALGLVWLVAGLTSSRSYSDLAQLSTD